MAEAQVMHGKKFISEFLKCPAKIVTFLTLSISLDNGDHPENSTKEISRDKPTHY